MTKDQDPRESVRSNVFLTALLVSSAGPTGVRVRNISAHGALLDGVSLPEDGSQVELHRGSLTIRGEIAWREENQCGMRFDREIVVREWVERVGHCGQQQVDRAIADLRRDGQPRTISDDAGGSYGPRPDLSSIATELNSICERLAASPNLSVELGEELLRIEALAHAIREFQP